MDKREPVYRKIGEKVLSGKAAKLSMADWQKLDTKWREAEDLTQRWLLKLDLSLPGRLGQFGQWLYNAERLLEKREQQVDEAEEMAVQMTNLIGEHKVFFKDLESQKQFFQQIKKAGRYEGESLHPPHLDLLHKRMDQVVKHAPRRQCRLEYLEVRYLLLAYLLAAEEKAALWTVKYGRLEEVEAMGEDYQVSDMESVVLVHQINSVMKSYVSVRLEHSSYIGRSAVEKVNSPSNFLNKQNCMILISFAGFCCEWATV